MDRVNPVVNGCCMDRVNPVVMDGSSSVDSVG